MLAPFLCHECQLDIRRTPRIGSVKHRNIVTSRHLLQVTGSVNESNIVAEPSWGKCFLLDIFRLGEIVLVCASFRNEDRGTSTRRIITADFTTRGSKSLSRNQPNSARASVDPHNSHKRHARTCTCPYYCPYCLSRTCTTLDNDADASIGGLLKNFQLPAHLAKSPFPCCSALIKEGLRRAMRGISLSHHLSHTPSLAPMDFFASCNSIFSTVSEPETEDLTTIPVDFDANHNAPGCTIA